MNEIAENVHTYNTDAMLVPEKVGNMHYGSNPGSCTYFTLPATDSDTDSDPDI